MSTKRYGKDEKYYPSDMITFSSKEEYDRAVREKAKEFADQVDELVIQKILNGELI